MNEKILFREYRIDISTYHFLTFDYEKELHIALHNKNFISVNKIEIVMNKKKKISFCNSRFWILVRSYSPFSEKGHYPK